MAQNDVNLAHQNFELQKALILRYDAIKSMNHCTVSFKLMIEKPTFRKEKIFFRSRKNIDKASFSNDLSQMIRASETEASGIDETVAMYNFNLRSLVDKHAPLKSKSITVRPNAPWYNKYIDSAKRYRRKLGHRWVKSGKKSDRLEFKNQCRLVAELVFSSKKSYYNSKIDSAGGQSKELFKIINNIFS